MNRSPPPRRRLSKRFSRDLKGNLQPKSDNLTLPLANSPTTPSNLSKNRRSRIPIPIGKVTKEVERIHQAEQVHETLARSAKTENSISSAALGDATTHTIPRSPTKSCLKRKSSVEGIETIQQEIARLESTEAATALRSSAIPLSSAESPLDREVNTEVAEPVPTSPLPTVQRSNSERVSFIDNDQSQAGESLTVNTTTEGSSLNNNSNELKESTAPPIPHNIKRNPSKRLSLHIKSEPTIQEEIEAAENALDIHAEIEQYNSYTHPDAPESPGPSTIQEEVEPANGITINLEIRQSTSDTHPDAPGPSGSSTNHRGPSKRVSWAGDSQAKPIEFEPTSSNGSFESELQRKFSMKSLRDIKGKGKAKADADAEETEASKPVKKLSSTFNAEFADGYTTVRNANTKSFVSYAYGKEVLRGDEWGYIHGLDQPESSKSATNRFKQVKNSLAGVSKTLASKVGLPVSKEKESDDHHNPIQIFGKPQTRLDRVMEDSETLNNLVDSVSKLNIFKKKKVPHRVWDRRDEAAQKRYLSKLQYQEIMSWNDEQITNFNEYSLHAVTTKQLKELQAKNPGTIIYANPFYRDPCPTPVGVQDGMEIYTDEEELEMRAAGETAVWGSPEDEDPNAEHNHRRKDLRMAHGAHKGFFIIPGTDGVVPDLFGQSSNFSDYYGEPLVELTRDHKEDMGPGYINLVEAEFQRAFKERELGPDYGVENRDTSDPYFFYSLSESWGDDEGSNYVYKPRAQLPGQAFMIYLAYGRVANEHMPWAVRNIDPKFLYEHESRWWNGYRIPQHTQITDEIANYIYRIAPRPKEWFELGKKPPSKDMIEIQERMRERETRRFWVMVVENYFFWRFKGITVHREAKSGSAMRRGEY